MHSATGELLSCAQVNGYQLAYYGIMLWVERPEPEERLAALLRAERYRPDVPEDGSAPAARQGAAERDAAAGAADPSNAKPRRLDRHEAEWEQVLELSRWRPVLLSEHEAKLANVRLRNDPGLRVFLREGRMEAEALRRDLQA